MSRRRLRVVCSSDEEDEEPQPPPPPPPPTQQEQYEEYDVTIDDMETDFQTVTLNSLNPTPSSNYSTTNRCRSRLDQPIPLDISDDDEENVIMSEATDGSSLDNANRNNNYIEVSESPVNGVLERFGLRLKKEWLESCLHGLQSSVAGSQRMDDSAKAKLCFEQFLRSDMNYCGAGVLPRDVHTLNLVDLKGPFVLQVDEMVNISCPLRRRYQNAGPGNSRCLKLSMTDGVQRVFGMEYRPIQDLQALAHAGLKVAVCNVHIRHGLLMLVPEVLQVLGGSVLELEAARQRLVNEINKPSRGKRNRTGVVPPLATRATLAAWPPDNNIVQGQVDRNTSVNTGPQRASTQGTPVNVPANGTQRQATTFPEGRNNAQPNLSFAQEHNEVPRHTDMHASIPLHVAGQGNVFGIPGNGRPREGFGVPMRSNPELSSLPEVQPVERVTISHDINEVSTQVETPSGETRQVTPPSIPADCISVENVGVSVCRHNLEPTGSSALPMDVEEITILDELEHQFMLSRNKDIPFTYLASLSAKCAAMEDEVSVVRGKIKCFLTAVKGFQYKQRPLYELRVFVDDGSLISEILIDHSVVQNGIGYSPQEVTTALDSSKSEQVSAMKETLKQFQRFLVNFEGTMLVEMNKASPRPVAVEMNQGCSASDACLLLKRLKSFGSRPDDLSHLNPITLSP
ncbi:recQ-mediated genome instability protein 1 [Orobanche minor]